MDLSKVKRLGQLAAKLGVGKETLVDHLNKHGHEDIAPKPNTKLTQDQIDLLIKDFHKDSQMREQASSIKIGGARGEGVELKEKSIIGVKKDREDQPSDEVVIKGYKKSEEEEPETEEPAKEEPKADKSQEDEQEKEAPEADKGSASPDQEEETGEKKEEPTAEPEKPKVEGPNVVGKVDLEEKQEKKKPEEEEKEKGKEEPAETEASDKAEGAKQEAEEVTEAPEDDKKGAEETPDQEEEKEDDQQEGEKTGDTITAKADKLQGPKVLGKIDLPESERKKKEAKQPVASSSEDKSKKRKRRRRKRIVKDKGKSTQGRGKAKTREEEIEITEKEIQEKLKETMSKIAGTTGKGKTARSKRREEKKKEQEDQELQEQETKKLQVTEFISVSELASIMDVSPSDVLQVCMNLGIIASINQRLDAEVIELVADEYDYEIEFIDVDEGDEEEVEEDDPEDLEPRAPIVTVMGHVDHGKTSLLDFIRKENVIAGEKGGITQHIGAYEVETDDGRKITFLDTPGHEAFTAMRARGAKVTDLAVIVVAADDSVMPQTKEAISHAQAAGVPIIFAINKVDKETSSPEKIKEQLANMNMLVEDWGGKYQSEDISAKTGLKVDSLLEKMLLEAELLDLKANPNKNANGTVVEALLDKGRGYLATILVQEGTLNVGDVVAAGSYMGKIKAMFNERGQRVQKAGPSEPVQILGLNGAPQAGEKLRGYDSEAEAKEVANKRGRIEREQGLRAQKHITLDEIGRRLALGTFKELNVIIKGDVDGSVEALSDSLEKLTTEEIQVNVVHKGVGAITETDVMLASASDAVIIGFQVRPSVTARQLAEKEHIEIRLYSVIYDAIEEVKSAMEGMLEPKIEEKILGNAEVRDVFKISRVGTVAGCYVLDGKILRNGNVRLVRDGIVVYTGELESLKRFKDDVKEVKSGFECGLNIKNYNDIKVGDVIECFTEVEVARKLEK